MNKHTLEYKISYRRNLPHIQPPGATLFVTFRLTGSIPLEVQKELMAEAERVEVMLARLTDPKKRSERAYLEQRRLFGRWDAALDGASHGPVWLRQPHVANLVAAELHGHHQKVYDLIVFCIMPNHVHVVYTPLRKENGHYHAMSAIMHSLKGRTALQANHCLSRSGEFWQHENYDHVIRDEAAQQRIIHYILNNPVKAGLVQNWQDWPWNYCQFDVGQP